MTDRFPLRVVDACTLPRPYREVLRPGEPLTGRDGQTRELPRFFYEIPSWQVALETPLTEHFMLWEFLNVDVREAELLRARWPRYVPCAITLLAAHLEIFRREVDTFVHVAANGGYRSPAHQLSTHASTHCWGTAANLYRVGDDVLNDQASVVKYNRVARRAMPAVFTRPFGHGAGEADDHVHLDVGYALVVPHGAPRDDESNNEDEEQSEAVPYAGAEP